jgi:hypothetical protein
MARKTGKVSAHRVEEHERIARAVALRRQGLTFQVIADTLGYSNRTAAYTAVRNYMVALGKPDAEYMREEEADRLDAALLAIWPRIRQGNLDAIDRMIRLMERRSRFFGLDAPTRVAPTNPGGDEPYAPLSVDEAVARFSAMIAAGASSPDAPVELSEMELAAARLAEMER